MNFSLYRSPLVAHCAAILLVFSSACGSDKAPGSQSNSDATTSIGGASSVSQASSEPIGQVGGASSAVSVTQVASGGVRVGQGGTASAQAGSSASLPDTTSTNSGVPTATVTLAPSTTFQTLEGFGAAVAWYQTTLTSHTKSAELYKILFADLGLDLIRFRNSFDRADFSNAPREKMILDAATASLGRRPKVLMTSWSPPASLKANALEKCSGETTCTLKMVNNAYVYEEFATYWFNALAAYKSVGITPDWISIQNEPDFIPTGWEGCKFAATESTSFPGYGKALAAVSAQLATLTDAPKLVGPESLGIHYNKLKAYLPALDTSLLSAVAHHLYEQGSDGIWDWRSPGPDSFITVMKGAKSAAGSLPIFQTEFQTDADNAIEGGFETAWLIHNSLVEAGVSAWLYWDLVWSAGHGLVALPDRVSYSIRDQYYSLRHYARYTDPGYVRIGATANNTNIRASAFRSPDASRITLVLLNVGTTEERVSLTLGGYAAKTSEVYRTIYLPGSSTTWESRPAVDQGGLLTLPSRSVATVVLNG